MQKLTFILLNLVFFNKRICLFCVRAVMQHTTIAGSVGYTSTSTLKASQFLYISQMPFIPIHHALFQWTKRAGMVLTRRARHLS